MSLIPTSRTRGNPALAGVHYYGYYSSVARGKCKKNDQDELIPCILEPDKDSKEYRKNWERLIQKIYEVDPLTCPKCFGKMKIICVIDNEVFSRPYRLGEIDGGQAHVSPA